MGCSILLDSGRSVSSGLEPALRGLGLYRIVVEWVPRPKILLTKTNDVILFDSTVNVEGFILGDEVRVGERGDRAHNTSCPHLRASVEKVGHIPHSNTVAHFETGLHAEGVFLQNAEVVLVLSQ